MIAADTSSLIGFIANDRKPDYNLVTAAIDAKTLRLPPPVLTELLSFPPLSSTLRPFLADLPLIPSVDGYWERAGDNRRLLLSKGLKAKMPDTLIAQCCIDADLPLISRDDDYRHFAKWCGLKLA